HSEATRDVKVHIENVKTITLHRGELTNGRRNTPIDQMRCVGGDACHRYSPDVIQCTNTGSDGLDVNWRCNAELPDYLKFGPRMGIYGTFKRNVLEGTFREGGGGFYPRDDSFYQNSYSSQNFWTGLGMGSLAGYFFGRNYSSSQPRTYFMQPTRFRTTFTSSSSSSSNMTNSQGFGRTKRR
ncbi:1893_t:CDS:2, partial [Scutellospora calospora]